MIIRISKHKLHDGIVIASVPYELNAMMGRFEPARWDGDVKGYLVEDQHIETLTRWAKTHGGHHVLDERPRLHNVEVSGPLPECSECGQPASRKVSMSLLVCPDCGAEWKPKVFREVPGEWTPPNAAYLAARGQLKGSPITLTPDQW